MFSSNNDAKLNNFLKISNKYMELFPPEDYTITATLLDLYNHNLMLVKKQKTNNKGEVSVMYST